MSLINWAFSTIATLVAKREYGPNQTAWKEEPSSTPESSQSDQARKSAPPSSQSGPRDQQ